MICAGVLAADSVVCRVASAGVETLTLAVNVTGVEVVGLRADGVFGLAEERVWAED